MTLEIRILGCGSSGGVPRPADGGPYWGACDPQNPKNRRRRCSILATLQDGGETRALVDTSPDLHSQLLEARIGSLDGVLITHDHADQTHGMDDLRPLALNMKKRLDLWTDSQALDSLRAKFGYVFESKRGSGYPPIVDAHEIPESFAPFEIFGAGGALSVLPFGVGHGRIRSLAYVLGGRVAYTPDADVLDEAALAALNGVECWIVDALRRPPHPSHAHLGRTLDWIARVKPARAILTNMHLDMDYETLRRELPPGIEPAYDGMTIIL